MKFVLRYKPTKGVLCFELPFDGYRMKLSEIIKKCMKKYNNYVSLDISPPYKPRTTGDLSQNNLLWFLITEIANYCGDNSEGMIDTENGIKQRALSKGYPYHLNKITGEKVPESMKYINTVQCSYLIDTAYEIIAELGIILPPPPTQYVNDYQKSLFDYQNEITEKAKESILASEEFND